MEAFRELGMRVERAWRATSFDERALPAIALGELERAELRKTVSPRDVLSWAITSEHLLPPRRQDREFGQPPILVFAGERFFIEVLFWLEGTTDVHQHAFSGAFTVLSGSSIESVFSFAPRFVINELMQLGDLQLQSLKLLPEGTCRPIVGGSALIHSVFHLDHPSVSVVVRTYQDSSAQPQLSYLRPHLAHSPHDADPYTTKRIQAVQVLLTTDLGGAWKHLDQLVQSPNFAVSYRALELSAQSGSSSTQLALCLAHARKVHGEKIDLVAAVLEENRRHAALIKRRREVTDPELRFALALLLNAPDRAALLGLVRERYGDDPIERVAGWVERLHPTPFDSAAERTGWTDGERQELREILGRAEGVANAEGLGRHLKANLVFQLLAR